MKGQETISYWETQTSLKNFPRLNKNLVADVCIVGAGISGLTAAYLLSKQNKSVIVLDDGPVGGGQTVRTTGHLTNALDDRYFNLAKYFGETNTKLISESHRAAIELIASLVKTHEIDCDFEYVDAYLFVPPRGSTKILEKELKAARKAGMKDVHFVDRCPFESYDTGRSLRFPGQAQFSPLPYLNKLCDLIRKQKGKIFCNSHVHEIHESNNKYNIRTDQNHSVHAKSVILATNTYTTSRLFPHTKQAPYRTYVIAGEIPRGSVTKAIYYDTLDPYHYIRISSLNKQHDLLIIGGEDHRTAEKKEISTLYEKLEKWSRHRFPMLGKIKYYWSGQVIEPVDSLAFIGRMKKGAEKYIITGDSGNGLTHGTLGAILISDLILGRRNPWEKIYNPHRISLINTPDFIKENANSFWQYRDWATKGNVDSEKKITINSGAIIRKGLKKYACYRNSQGKIQKFSAVCPHLGAILRWNNSEHCWECPAHGSRYNTDGEILQGPANSHLRSEKENDEKGKTR